MSENVFKAIADYFNDNTRITIDADDVKSLFESLIPEDPEFDCELGCYVCPMCKHRIDNVGIFKCEFCGKALTKFDKNQYIVKYKDLLEYAVRNANKNLIRYISKKKKNLMKIQSLELIPEISNNFIWIFQKLNVKKFMI